MVYKWKLPSLFNVDADVAGREIQRIYEEHGAVEPQVLVDESKDERAPLHSLFEWDDDKAANLYRNQQARCIIKNIVIEEDEERRSRTRAFVHVRKGYQPLSVVLESPDKTDELLNQARRDMASFKAKYERLIELAGVIKAIDAVL